MEHAVENVAKGVEAGSQGHATVASENESESVIPPAATVQALPAEVVPDEPPQQTTTTTTTTTMEEPAREQGGHATAIETTADPSSHAATVVNPTTAPEPVHDQSQQSYLQEPQLDVVMESDHEQSVSDENDLSAAALNSLLLTTTTAVRLRPRGPGPGPGSPSPRPAERTRYRPGQRSIGRSTFPPLIDCTID